MKEFFIKNNKSILFLLLSVILRVLFYIFKGETFYEYMSYLFLVGFFLVVLFDDKLSELSFFGLKAKGSVDNTTQIQGKIFNKEDNE